MMTKYFEGAEIFSRSVAARVPSSARPRMSGGVFELLVEWVDRPSESTRAVNSLGRLAGIASSRGLVRSENQDRALAVRCTGFSSNAYDFVLGIVADGIGGLPNGSRCATLAVSAFVNGLILGADTLENSILAAVHAANKCVFDYAKGRGGTTLAGCLIASNGQAFAFSVGDSKVYRAARTGELVQITTDDTIAGQLAAAGHRAESSVAEHKQLIQFAGVGIGLEPQLYNLSRDAFEGNARWLVAATDGVSILSRNVAAQLLLNAVDARSAATRVVQLADWFGGPDNSSVAILDVEEILAAFGMPPDLRVTRVIDTSGTIDVATYIQIREVPRQEKNGIAKGLRPKRRGKKAPRAAASEERAKTGTSDQRSSEPSVELLDSVDSAHPIVSPLIEITQADVRASNEAESHQQKLIE